MTQTKHTLAALLLAMTVVAPCASSATQVQVQGAVDHAGARDLPGNARLSDAALAAAVRSDAYALGAAWLRPSLLVEQRRAKAGMLFDLDSVRRDALQRENDGLVALVTSMIHWLDSLPVTGRQVALLDPRAVEVNAAENRPVAEGDTLYYPQRPATIRVVGAVEHACELPHVALQDAKKYLHACPLTKWADADDIYVIQPDGRVIEQGVALWNRSQPLPLAPGAMIYVPLREWSVRGLAPDLNKEVAAFLATQPIAGPENPR